MNVLLTIAAYLWVHRRDMAELAGLVLVVSTAWLYDPLLGLLCAGIALILAANFAGRS